MENICSNCSHSMKSEVEGQILCIANPPVPIVTIQGQIISIFPSMMGWGKCDTFNEGVTQELSSSPEIEEEFVEYEDVDDEVLALEEKNETITDLKVVN